MMRLLICSLLSFISFAGLTQNIDSTSHQDLLLDTLTNHTIDTTTSTVQILPSNTITDSNSITITKDSLLRYATNGIQDSAVISFTIDSLVLEKKDTLAPLPTPTPIISALKNVKKRDSIFDILLALKIVDSITNEPLAVSIHMTTLRSKKGHLRTGEGISDSEGKFHFRMTNRSAFVLTINSTGYHTYTDTLDMIKEQYTKGIYTKVCHLKKFRKGDVVKLENIYFKSGDHQLLATSYSALNKLLLLMKKNPQMTIRLGGHTDNSCSHSACIRLSEQRVKEVRFYLVKKGIKVSRIKAVGYGYTQPISTINTIEKQKLNRRVELTILRI